MNSLDHEIKDLKQHLRSKDFFEIRKYKTATFKLLKPSHIKNGKVLIRGVMKIKDKQNQEEINAKLIIEDTSIRIQFNVEIDRTKYGVKYNSPSFFKKLKENAIANKFTLKGNVLFKR